MMRQRRPRETMDVRRKCLTAEEMRQAKPPPPQVLMPGTPSFPPRSSDTPLEPRQHRPYRSAECRSTSDGFSGGRFQERAAQAETAPAPLEPRTTWARKETPLGSCRAQTKYPHGPAPDALDRPKSTASSLH